MAKRSFELKGVPKQELGNEKACFRTQRTSRARGQGGFQVGSPHTAGIMREHLHIGTDQGLEFRVIGDGLEMLDGFPLGQVD